MDNYRKGEVRQLEDSHHLQMSESAVHMKVNYGSKIRNLMGYAMKKIKEPDVRQLSWSGSGNAATKVVSCAEIMKRKIKGLHQVTDIRLKRTEEYWEPTIEGLERLKVNRDVPAITILLSKDALDPSLPGYQPPGALEPFWKQSVKDDKKTRLDKRNQSKKGTSSGGEAFSIPQKKKKNVGPHDTRKEASIKENKARKASSQMTETYSGNTECTSVDQKGQ